MRLTTISCVASCLALGAMTGVAAQAGLVGHWRFDERGGSFASDDTGQNLGTLLGAAAFAPSEGISGGAIKFERATNDVVDVGAAFPFVGAQPFTMSLWVRFANAGELMQSFPIGRHQGGIVAGYLIGINVSGGAGGYGAPNKPWLYQSNYPGAEPIGTTSVNDGEWHHIVAVHNDGGQSKIYIDGAPAESSVASLPIAPIDVTTLIGGVYVGATPTGFFDGLIDDVQMYDSALNCAQVQYLFEHAGVALLEYANPMDLDGNGSVNASDLGVLLGQWGPCIDNCTADFDCNGSIDAADLGALLGAWTN